MIMIKRTKLDALFSKYIKLRAGGYCQFDSKFFGVRSRGLHCAHCFSRGRRLVRHHPDNAVALCYYHHMYLDHHPLEKAEFFLGKLGTKKYMALKRLADKTTKEVPLDLEKTEQLLKEQILFLEEK